MLITGVRVQVPPRAPKSIDPNGAGAFFVSGKREKCTRFRPAEKGDGSVCFLYVAMKSEKGGAFFRGEGRLVAGKSIPELCDIWRKCSKESDAALDDWVELQ